ncbi:MAG: DUF2799 domain-containing protein [Desulfobacteraceae bacterium]
MGKDECLHADWQTIGYEDGARGYPGTRIGEHRKACAKHGIAPDLAAYEAGRQTGLKVWCTPRNGYRLGLKGKRYNGVCPELLEDAFVEALGRGRAVYGYANQVKKARQELKEMHVELEAMDTDLNAMEAELVSEGATPRRRVHLLRKIRQLETDRDLFLNDIEDLEAQVADMQANLKRMRADAP